MNFPLLFQSHFSFEKLVVTAHEDEGGKQFTRQATAS